MAITVSKIQKHINTLSGDEDPNGQYFGAPGQRMVVGAPINKTFICKGGLVWYEDKTESIGTGGGTDPGFTDTTWANLLTETREAGQKWNITTAKAGYSSAFGKVTLISSGTFYWEDAEGFHEIINIV